MTTAAHSATEIERRALALFEHLADRPGDARLRGRMTANESGAVLARLAALEASVTRAAGALPTLIPGSGDCDGALLPPERVGAFRLVERIGRGGMGDVWLGERDDGLYDQRVAIKLIQRHALARAAGAFDDERRFLARLDHPNIAKLIDGGVTDDGLPWLAMEYFAGTTIDAAAAGLPLRARVRLFVKAADAVSHAHGRMVAHADLKPGNILVGGDGRVKLLDFGIAGLIEGARDRDAATPPGSGPLTRAFASPQRLAGDGPSVADDVYALGRTLALIAGDDADHEIAAIIARASADDVAARYASVAALIADLDRWRDDFPVSALPQRMTYRAGKFLDRHRLGVVAAGTALVLLGATSLIATSSYLRAEGAQRLATQRYGEVRLLSRYMLYDLYDQLARQPGTVARRAQMARMAAQRLDAMRLDGNAPQPLLLEAARAYRRLAAIEGLPYVSNLGDPDAANAALARAEALLDAVIAAHPRDAAALAERGWVHADRWTLLADNQGSADLSAATTRDFDAALAIDPGNALAALGRVAAAKCRGYDLIWSANRPAAAIPLLRAALVQLRARRWPTALADQARSLEINLLGRLGDAIYYAGDIPAALAPYREADALVDHAIASEGATPQWQIIKADQAFNLSGTLGDMPGHNAEALRIADASVASIETLLRAGADAAAEKRLLILYGEQALVLEQMGRISDAIEPSRRSYELRQARLARSPGDPQRMRDFGVGAMPHAELLARARRPADACTTARAALAMWQAIGTAGHLSEFDRTHNLSRAGTLVDNLCRR